MIRRAARWPIAATLAVAVPATAQTIPFADTEDATLSEVDVGPGDVHPFVSVDVRNGDYARGAYDDDNAALDRVPLHLALGGAIVLRRKRRGDGTAGDATLFLIGQSSNGFHAPRRRERATPRAWYESNSLLGLAWRPLPGLSAAATYAIKTSPNGVAPTSHEASLTFLYAADAGFGRLRPLFAVTRRPRGGGGTYTIAGIGPSLPLSDRQDGPTLGLPVQLGIGWGGFYAPGSGNRVFGSAGLSFAHPIRLGGAKATLQADLLALLRDGALRRLDAPHGTTAALVPYATLSLAMAW